MTEQENKISAFDIFSQSQETFEEAKKKTASESGSRTKHFRMSKDGTYCVRALPIAPVIDKDGKALPLDRKGYEYPIKDMVLKITGKDNKGKEKQTFVNVCNVKYAFPDLGCDLIDEYVSVASDLYSDDEALIKKIKESSFNGGLKWNSNRCLYMLDGDKREDGIQILSLSYSQYKDLEERKIKLWEKLLAKNPKAACPISSFSDAYLIEITRKTEKKKTEYTFNIDTVSDTDSLSEEELNNLLDAPRLPEALYRYTRFHLEATIAFLNQFDEKLQIDVMNDPKIIDCIDKIKMTLPADDTSHFTFDGNTEAAAQSGANGIDALWDAYDRLDEQGLDDKSEEGQDLRADIKEFIETNDLEVTVSRKKTNLDLLKEIEDALSEGEGDDKKETKPAPAPDPEPEPEPEEPAKEPEPETRSARGRRNEDTNEPAERTERRSARPERRARR